jgi:hypothetical protein
MPGGRPRVISTGDLIDDSDPVVKDYPRHFEDVETYVSGRDGSQVEQATAEPGEKRNRRMPVRKTTTDKEEA